jgi:predicted RNA binding protein YcfA (HicA-like mRNA interferase family)
MTKLPSLTGKDIISIFKKLGFEIKRQKGSHVFLQHPDGRATVVPIHSGETIGPGLMAKILRDLNMTKEEFHQLLKEK